MERKQTIEGDMAYGLTLRHTDTSNLTLYLMGVGGEDIECAP